MLSSSLNSYNFAVITHESQLTQFGTETENSEKKTKSKFRRASLGHSIFNSTNRQQQTDQKRKMSTGASESALFLSSVSHQSPPVGRIGNNSRVSNRPKSDKGRTPREEQTNKLSKINRDRLERWSESLHDLLSDSVGIRLFEEFLVKECSQENLAFWRACKEYTDQWATPDNKLQRSAESIFSEFISHQAPNLVNIDHSVRSSITTSMTSGATRTTFNQAMSSIFMLMERDSFSRFVKQPEFVEALALSKVF